MFVQVIKGKVTSADAVQQMGERWNAELRPGATGFLGATIGVADDGTLVNLARFESREAAMANSARAEQGAWWADFERCFDGEPSFKESEDVVVYQNGDIDSAGFVQVMEGRVHDAQRARTWAGEVEGMLAQERPDLLGDLTLLHADGTYTQVAYFPSEAEARAGESKEPSEAVKKALAEMGELFTVESYTDIRDPWLF